MQGRDSDSFASFCADLIKFRSFHLLLLVLCLAACHRSAPPKSAQEEPIKPRASPQSATKIPEDEKRGELIREGEQLLPSLSKQQDDAHGTTWFQATVPAQGSAVYLRCGKLGQQGAVSLRLIVRHVGDAWLNVSGCSLRINGKEIGAFAPSKGKLEKLPDGRIAEFLDADFLDVRPLILALIDAQSGTIRLVGANGDADLAVDRSQIEEMRKVLAAYEYLNAAPPAAR